MLETVIFDLDGTLWQTGDSYLYAYHKLCDHYGVEPTVSDDIILSCLGVKLENFLPQLFPSATDKMELFYRAMGYSIEYIVKNPHGCCFPGVSNLLQQLAKEYKIYIVSNCLDRYVETFLKLSGTTEYVSGFSTIQSGSKEDHIARIAARSQGKVLLVGDSDDDYDAISDHEKILFCYAAYGYKPCVHYAYRIETPLQLLQVTCQLQIRERQLQGKTYRVLSRGENQITYIKNPDGTAYFGFVRYADEGFEQVICQLKEIASGGVLGPMDSNTFYSYRLAVDEFSWRLYPDCISDEKVFAALRDHGFRISQFYTSTLATTNQKIWSVAKKAKLPTNFKIVEATGEAAYQYLNDIYDVAIDAFSRADFYEPISREDFLEIYMQNLRAVTPDLLMIYDGDAPVAFCFCYEDPEKRFYVCKTIAVRSDCRNRELLLALIDRSYQMMHRRGYENVLYHFQNDRSKVLNRIFRGCVLRQKRYALMEYRHDLQ